MDMLKKLIDKIDNVIPKNFEGKPVSDSLRFSIPVYVVGNMALSGAFTVIKNISYDYIDDAIIIEVCSEV